jgi:hypothetical protein
MFNGKAPRYGKLNRLLFRTEPLTLRRLVSAPIEMLYELANPPTAERNICWARA